MHVAPWNKTGGRDDLGARRGSGHHGSGQRRTSSQQSRQHRVVEARGDLGTVRSIAAHPLLLTRAEQARCRDRRPTGRRDRGSDRQWPASGG
jgi:hypothetical protein